MVIKISKPILDPTNLYIFGLIKFLLTNYEIGVIWMRPIMLRTTQLLSDNLLVLKALEHVDVDELLCENKVVF